MKRARKSKKQSRVIYLKLDADLNETVRSHALREDRPLNTQLNRIIREYYRHISPDSGSPGE
jgi:hypothetical protein